MRRHLSLIGITCALVLGGWGNVLAAALCPHAPADVSVSDARACCRTSQQNAGADGGEAHCSGTTGKVDDAASPDETASHEEAVTHHEASRPDRGHHAAGPEGRHVVAGLAVGNSSCDHCVGRPEQLPAFARASASGETKRDAAAPATTAQRAWRTVIASCTPITASSRGAPPGGARRHVLINVFLI